MRRLGITVGAALAGAACFAGVALAGHPSAGREPAGALRAPPAAAPGCPDRVEPGGLMSAQRLRALNRRMYRFGPRPTASPEHTRFVDWLARKARALPGMRVRSLRYRINRWLERRTALRAGRQGALGRVEVSAPVPYAGRTGRRGVRAPLVYLPPGEEIGAGAAGRIVVRDVVTVPIPNAVLAALQWTTYDPDLSLTLDALGSYERDSGYPAVVEDLRAARAAGAAGVIFVDGFPRRQMKGKYAPYEGERWRVPAVYVGADQGARLRRLAAAGGRAQLRVSASSGWAPTRTVIATLPGLSPERVVIESHTDGINAIWDNGPIGMLALARHFAKLPRRCRPRTIEFAFTTAHLYQQLFPPTRDGGAEQYAQQLDRDYERGTLALVVAMEHLGARQYEPEPRPGGRPGRVLVRTEHTEPNSFFAGESPVLIGALRQAIAGRGLSRSLILRGADLPGVRIPIHHSFGGEGGPYHQHLLPTVALITGPWTLFNAAFGMEAVDSGLMHRQVLVLGDFVHALDRYSRSEIAGLYPTQREVRSLLCGLEGEGLGLVECPVE